MSPSVPSGTGPLSFLLLAGGVGQGAERGGGQVLSGRWAFPTLRDKNSAGRAAQGRLCLRSCGLRWDEPLGQGQATLGRVSPPFQGWPRSADRAVTRIHSGHTCSSGAQAHIPRPSLLESPGEWKGRRPLPRDLCAGQRPGQGKSRGNPPGGIPLSPPPLPLPFDLTKAPGLSLVSYLPVTEGTQRDQASRPPIWAPSTLTGLAV